jgi:hypothetical protein
MLVCFRIGLLFAALALCGGAAAADDPQADQPAEETPYEFVSGIVVELTSERIVVNRAVPGRPPENRTFIINGTTIVEGKLRVNVRVTVGYKPNGEGDPVAVRIIVRQQQQREREP